MLQFIEFSWLLIIDVIFVLVLFLLMLPLIRRQAAFAVMKRNFAGYFSNPTGYVFLCIFVLLTSFAAFWPHEFFTTNLANFDQLNKLLPYIMLVFIPAITMSIWAEERRQGTDELLLSLPALDFDIVIGKYFAAVWVFTVSLLFSQLSNYAVLLAMTGGQLDTMLLFSTYLGYWFMGIAMIAIGMVASFLTNNLTVGFIFGAALNAPLAFFSNADVIFSNAKWVQWLFDWSLLQRFEPFGRGLVSLPSALYFIGIAVIGIYLSLILIGRRHWLGGRDGTSMLWHYMVRAGCLIVTVIACVLVVQYSPLNGVRMDISAEKVSTLSDATIKVLDRLAHDDKGPPIKIEAFVSNNVPTEYVQTKYDLVNLLREFDVRGGNRVQVKLHQGIEPFSEEAILAEKRFGIRPVSVLSESRGAVRNEQVVLGVAFTSGLERVVIPFFPYGMPVEYELMRSINTVSKSGRKTLGIVQTDAFPMGAVLSANGQSLQIPRLRIIEELQKQYDIESVSAATPIPLWVSDDEGKPLKRRYDALIVVQPSKMTPTELTNLIDAIQSGEPTAIFEDPLPNPSNFTVPGSDQSYISGTFFPRQVDRNGQETADIQKLWDALDIDVDRVSTERNGEKLLIPYLVWQLSDNPYPRDSQLNLAELVVIRDEDPATNPRFGNHPSTRGISELYFQLTGYLEPIQNSTLVFDPLVSTGELTKAGRILLSNFLGAPNEEARAAQRGSANRHFFLAAHIHGDPIDDTPPPSLDKVVESKNQTNVIYVADMDILADYFVEIRNNPIQRGIEYRFQNMSFVLNLVDSLTGETTYFDIRNRKFRNVTLRVVEATTEKAMQEVYDLTQENEINFSVARDEIQNKIQQEIGPRVEQYRQEEEKRKKGEPIDMAAHTALLGLLEQKQREQKQIYDRKIEELQNESREKLRRIQLDAELKIQRIQRKFKLMAVLIPPIPPLLVGLIVFTRRRLREREGISKARRLK